jgi:ligand-binding sensor domain-containing protein
MNVFAIGSPLRRRRPQAFRGYSDASHSVIAAANGSIRVGAQDGLTSWKDGQITIFRKAGGLPDDASPSLFQDGRGRIWAFTGQGLVVRGGQVHFITGDKAVA